MQEGVDYELILNDEQDENWSCRILTGDWPETVIKYHALAVNEVSDNLSFNFHVVSSPDPNAHIDNEDLQMVAGECLQAIFDVCIEEGSAKFTDRETGKELTADEVFSDGTAG